MKVDEKGKKPAGVANLPYRSLLGPLLYLSVIIFNLTVTYIIGENLMALNGLFIYVLPVTIVLVGIMRRVNRYGREELADHLRDYPWSSAGGVR